jgi:hypothetical protein
MKSFLNVRGGSILSKFLWSIIFSFGAVILYLQKGINNMLLFLSKVSMHVDSVYQSNTLVSKHFSTREIVRTHATVAAPYQPVAAT